MIEGALVNWQLVPQFVLTGLLNGGPIALIALGLVLIFKTSYIFNFAQGQMMLIGAMTTWWFAVEKGLNFWLAASLGMLITALLGWLIDWFALRPMTGQPLLSIILMTLGLSQALQGLVLLTFSSQQRNFPSPFPNSDPYTLSFPGIEREIILKQTLVWSSLTAFLGVILIGAFFQYTRIGLAMRAASEDHELAQSGGLRIRRIFGISWAMAGVISATSGIFLASISSGLDSSLWLLVLTAFPAVLLGGLDSIPGAVVGGLVVGLSRWVVKASQVEIIRESSEIMPYVLLLIVLIIRPEGLFGQKRIERI